MLGRVGAGWRRYRSGLAEGIEGEVVERELTNLIEAGARERCRSVTGVQGKSIEFGGFREGLSRDRGSCRSTELMDIEMNVSGVHGLEENVTSTTLGLSECFHWASAWRPDARSKVMVSIQAVPGGG